MIMMENAGMWSQLHPGVFAPFFGGQKTVGGFGVSKYGDRA